MRIRLLVSGTGMLFMIFFPLLWNLEYFPLNWWLVSISTRSPYLLEQILYELFCDWGRVLNTSYFVIKVYFCEVLFILTEKVNMVAYSSIPNVREVEAEGSRMSTLESLRLAWNTWSFTAKWNWKFEHKYKLKF